ncbi:hypothetical protein Tco_1125852 [Tanacetum coccineum]
MSNPSTKYFDASVVKMEAPKELPKVSLVNERLKNLKFHLAKFDNVVKIRTTPDARTKGNILLYNTNCQLNKLSSCVCPNPTSKPSIASPVKIEAPKELPKVSLVNERLKKLKFHLARFDTVVKIRTTPDARIEGEWRFKHNKAIFNNEIIPFLKSLKDIFNVFDRDLLNEIMEVHIVFDQMDAAVQQSSVDKQCLEIAKK